MTKATRSALGVSEETPPFAAKARKPMAQRTYERDNTPKRAVNLTASAYWMHEAKALGLNLSEIFGDALENAVRNGIRVKLEREAADFSLWYNKDIEEHGLWSDGFRLF